MAVVLTLLVASASVAVSFTGLIAAAGWAGIPPLLRPALPVVVDASILVFTVAAVVARGRGESTRLAWGSVAAFTAVSVVTNAAHALGDGVSTASSITTYLLGAFLAGLMPLACFVATHTVVSLVVAPPEGSVTQRRKAERARNRTHGQPAQQHARTSTAQEQPPAAASPTPSRTGTGTASRPTVADTTSSIDYQLVRSLAADGLSQRAIAEQLGTSKSTVARALKEPARETVAA
jgi:hypothetical protein